MKKIFWGVLIGVAAFSLLAFVWSNHDRLAQANKQLVIYEELVESLRKSDWISMNEKLAAENKELWASNRDFDGGMKELVNGIKTICANGYAEKDPNYCGQFK